MARIKRAILSCFDKSDIVELAEALRDFDVEIIATEGTLSALNDSGVAAKGISEFTGVREMMDGRVKTLHPKVHAGLLGIRDNKVHADELETYECQWVDFVAVNLRPVGDIASNPAITLEEVVEQVDIGGTAMIRSAAKNYRYVTVAVNPDRYSSIIHELRANDGEIPFLSRFQLAQDAFARTARYDEELSDFLRSHEPKDA